MEELIKEIEDTLDYFDSREKQLGVELQQAIAAHNARLEEINNSRKHLHHKLMQAKAQASKN